MPTPTLWTPPDGAQERNIAEFIKFTKIGDTLIARLSARKVLKDQFGPGKDSDFWLCEPAIWMPGGRQSDAAGFAQVALGASAGLRLVLGESALGQCVAIIYTGDREPKQRGFAGAKQFRVYTLTPDDLATEWAKISNDDLPF